MRKTAILAHTEPFPTQRTRQSISHAETTEIIESSFPSPSLRERHSLGACTFFVAPSQCYGERTQRPLRTLRERNSESLRSLRDNAGTLPLTLCERGNK